MGAQYFVISIAVVGTFIVPARAQEAKGDTDSQRTHQQASTKEMSANRDLGYILELHASNALSKRISELNKVTYLQERRIFIQDVLSSDLDVGTKEKYIREIQELFKNDLGMLQILVNSLENVKAFDDEILSKNLSSLNQIVSELKEDIRIKEVLTESSPLQHFGLAGRQLEALDEISAFPIERQNGFRSSLQHIIQSNPAKAARIKALSVLVGLNEELSPVYIEKALHLLGESSGEVQKQKLLLETLLKTKDSEIKLSPRDIKTFLVLLSSSEPKIVSLTLKVLAKSPGYTQELADKIIELPKKWPGFFELEMMSALIKGPFTAEAFHKSVTSSFPALKPQVKKLIFEEYLARIPSKDKQPFASFIVNELDSPDPELRNLAAQAIRGSGLSFFGVQPMLNFLDRPENKEDVEVALSLVLRGVHSSTDQKLITNFVENARKSNKGGAAHELIAETMSKDYSSISLNEFLLDATFEEDAQWADKTLAVLNINQNSSSSSTPDFLTQRKLAEFDAHDKPRQEQLIRNAFDTQNYPMMRAFISRMPNLKTELTTDLLIALAKKSEWELVKIILDDPQKNALEEWDLVDVLRLAINDKQAHLFEPLIDRISPASLVYHNIVEQLAAFGELKTLKYVSKKHPHTIRFGASELQSAAQHGQLDVVKYLIENKVDDPESLSYAFFGAVKSGHLDIVEYLLPKGHNRAFLTTALKEAAVLGQIEIVKHLMNEGATVDDEAMRLLLSSISSKQRKSFKPEKVE